MPNHAKCQNQAWPPCRDFFVFILFLALTFKMRQMGKLDRECKVLDTIRKMDLIANYYFCPVILTNLIFFIG